VVDMEVVEKSSKSPKDKNLVEVVVGVREAPRNLDSKRPEDRNLVGVGALEEGEMNGSRRDRRK